MKRIFYLTSSSTKAFFFLFFLACAVGLNAQTASLSVQGVLTRSDGTAVDDGNDYTLTFRLWTAESGGTKVHEETINDISIVGGVYSVVLGVEPGNPPLTAPFSQTYWLGVSVGTSSVELLPRPRLTHAPYALAIVGNNNIFPSTGPVIADALNVSGTTNSQGFRALGGAPTNSNGYSFSTGDTDGGIFSLQDNNVSIYANNVKALEATNSGVTIPGFLSVSGAAATGPHTVNGWQEVNGFQTINSNQIVNGFSTVTANQTVDGIVRSGGGIVNKAFTNTGMFMGPGNRDINFNVNGGNRILLGDNGVNYYNGQNVFTDGSQFYLFGNVPDFNGKNMQWNETTKQVGADNSSRRFKENIETLNEDWSLILKARPVTYTRKSNPSLREIGYIAEEMDSIGLKRLVEHDGNGVIDGFDYERMILYVTEVVKIQHADIKNLQAEVAQLKAENTGLTTLNKTLNTTNTELERQQEEINKQLAGLLKRMQALEASSTGK